MRGNMVRDSLCEVLNARFECLLEALVNFSEALDVCSAMGHLGVEIREPFGELDGLSALEGDDDPVGLGIPEQTRELRQQQKELGRVRVNRELR